MGIFWVRAWCIRSAYVWHDRRLLSLLQQRERGRPKSATTILLRNQRLRTMCSSAMKPTARQSWRQLAQSRCCTLRKWGCTN